MSRRIRFLAARFAPRSACAVALALVAACGGDKPSGPTPPGAAARLTVVSGDEQTGVAGAELPQPIVARVVDAKGTPVGGQIVNFVVTKGGGHVFAGASVSNAQGIVQERWTLGTVATDSQKIEARAVDNATGQTLVFGSFTATAVASAADTIALAGGDHQTATAGAVTPLRPSVRLADSFGNPVAGVPVTFTVEAGGGSVTGGTVTSDSAGVATVGGWTLGPLAGAPNTLRATSGALVRTFTATASNPLRVAISSPTQGQTVGDQMPVVVSATSLAGGGSVASVSATLGTQEVALTRSGTTNDWTGSLSLQGLTNGTKTLTVRAADAAGNSATATTTVTHDPAPALTLTVDDPVDGLVVPGTSTRLRASCVVASGGTCTISVRTTFDSPGTPDLARGTGSVDVTPSLAAHAGFERQLIFTATWTPCLGCTTQVTQLRTIFVEPSTRLSRVDSVPGSIVDVTSDRILYAAGAYYTGSGSLGAPTIRNRVTRADDQASTLLTQTRPRMSSFLTRSGAYVTSYAAPDNLSVTEAYDWSGGSLTDLGPGSPTTVRFAGDYVSWTELTVKRAWRRDLAAHSSVLVWTPASALDVAANGDVIYSHTESVSSDARLFRYRAGEETALTPAGTCSANPRTDGTLVVFRRYESCETVPSSTRTRTVVTDGVTETALTSYALQSQVYSVVRGWVVFTKPLASGDRELWTRSPAGVERQVATVPGNAFLELEDMGPADEIVYRIVGDNRYVAVLAGSSYNVTPIGSALGASYWIDGRLYVGIGGTLFSASY